MKKTRIIIARPGEDAFVTEITPDANILKKLVGGHISESHPLGPDVAILCDCEGKQHNRLPNRYLTGKHAKALIDKGWNVDIYAGSIVIIGSNKEGFLSLTDEQITFYLDVYGEPQFMCDWDLDTSERSRKLCLIHCMC